MDVLVVDDEPSIRRLLRRLLEGEGHVVSEAENGDAALLLIAEAPPNLVVTDMMMPVMGGRELIARLRADDRTAGIPIVVVSSETRLQELAVHATLPKPFELSAVVRAVQSALDGGQR